MASSPICFFSIIHWHHVPRRGRTPEHDLVSLGRDETDAVAKRDRWITEVRQVPPATLLHPSHGNEKW